MPPTPLSGFSMVAHLLVNLVTWISRSIRKRFRKPGSHAPLGRVPFGQGLSGMILSYAMIAVIFVAVVGLGGTILVTGLRSHATFTLVDELAHDVWAGPNAAVAASRAEDVAVNAPSADGGPPGVGTVAPDHAEPAVISDDCDTTYGPIDPVCQTSPSAASGVSVGLNDGTASTRKSDGGQDDAVAERGEPLPMSATRRKAGDTTYIND